MEVIPRLRGDADDGAEYLVEPKSGSDTKTLKHVYRISLAPLLLYRRGGEAGSLAKFHPANCVVPLAKFVVAAQDRHNQTVACDGSGLTKAVTQTIPHRIQSFRSFPLHHIAHPQNQSVNMPKNKGKVSLLTPLSASPSHIQHRWRIRRDRLLPLPD